jgi:8-oxo-dGTP pyrophosphatase MutT (NUDIX family)
MPHIHTEPNQHDVTVSAWLFRGEKEQEVFVHMHRKIQKYMEIGGHMELDETPWQTIVREMEEEAGYKLGDLEIYQPDYMPVVLKSNVVHPVPALLLTYQPIPGHYHSDIIYVFHEISGASALPHDGESSDLRWMTFDELEQGKKEGTVLSDVEEIYAALRKVIASNSYKRMSISLFSLDKPPYNDEIIEKPVQ